MKHRGFILTRQGRAWIAIGHDGYFGTFATRAIAEEEIDRYLDHPYWGPFRQQHEAGISASPLTA